jgi:hypothetical protein
MRRVSRVEAFDLYLDDSYPAAVGGVVERLVTQTSPQLDRSGPYLGTTLRTLTFT